MDTDEGRGDGGREDRLRRTGDQLLSRTFLVRALLETDDGEAPPAWHGFVKDVATGEQALWNRSNDFVRFIRHQLSGHDAPYAAGPDGALAMTAPPFTDVVTDMLTVLGSRLPLPVPSLPDPSVTLERVSHRLVGLGNHRGVEPASPLGARMLRGGRLDARVRFQVWATTPTAVDDTLVALQTDLLDDREQLRADGFLTLTGAETTLAERVEVFDCWRKTTSFDVLYEYRYEDADGAHSLITRIPVTTDQETTGGPGRETETLSDDIARWDDELAPPLLVRGPTTVHRLSAMVNETGSPLGGTITVRRSVAGSSDPVSSHVSLDAFLTAVGDPDAPDRSADITLAAGALLSSLGPTGDTVELGDWDADGSTDSYVGFDRRLDLPVRLSTTADQLSVSYTPPPGPATGLDQKAVVYLRVNAP